LALIVTVVIAVTATDANNRKLSVQKEVDRESVLSPMMLEQCQ
jgi:hypothetical protein